MAVLTITKDNFQTEVMQSDKPVLLDFWATWCGPCRMVSPIVDEIAEERTDIKVGKINVDEQGELAQQFGVMSIPTLVVMKNGQIANKAVGAMPKNNILAPPLLPRSSSVQITCSIFRKHSGSERLSSCIYPLMRFRAR